MHQWIALGNALVVPNDILKGRVTYGFDQDEGQNYPTPCQKKNKNNAVYQSSRTERKERHCVFIVLRKHKVMF